LGLVLGYVAEEWMHYSIHFAQLPGSYAAQRRRYHLRHHNSPDARPYGFGITSSFWDIIGGTSFPERSLGRHPEARVSASRRCGSPAYGSAS
jgi:sterol desaturase/sphingolipid hydroxylase (fatty acid hydroxylase superfamily)